MKHYFIDNIYIMTDYMGGWTNQYKEIGWYDSKSGKYFNLDEVREIFNQGEAENVGIRKDGTLYMKSCWLDARTAFSVICGIPFDVDKKHLNLINYAYKMGWATKKQIPIQIYMRTKTLDINKDCTYTIRYIIDKEKYTSPCIEFVEKICVGKVKRLKNQTHYYHHDGIKEKVHEFLCGEVSFDRENLTLIINDIPYSDIFKRNLIDAIRNLDLELLISNPNIVNFSNVLSACHDWCRDCGQYHWIGDYNKEKEENSNVYWYDK